MSKFNMGIVYISVTVVHAMGKNEQFVNEVMDILQRYQSEDWGDDLHPDVKKLLDRAARTGDDRILGAFHTTGGKILIETKKDRSATNICFATEYKQEGLSV